MHADFIDALGGITVVAKHCGIAINQVGNWRIRGVSWPFRSAVAILAKKKKVPLPVGFLGQSPSTEPTPAPSSRKANIRNTSNGRAA